MADESGRFANGLVRVIGGLLDIVERLLRPFRRGRRYRVRETFDGSGGFTAGDVLTFEAYDDPIKDPVVSYHFKDATGRQRTLNVDCAMPLMERRKLARRRFERL